MPDYAYHFTGPTLRDGSPLPAIGEWEVFAGPVVMCESGLHASRDPFDALKYAPGENLRLVEVEHIEAEQDDKLVCRRRRTVKQINAAPLLREFARWCASQVLYLWDAPQVVRDYLATGDESLRDAARDAASAAARDAASAAARDTARDAAWDAASAAARDAARDAAWAAALAAASAAARDAARDAAWAAARAAERAAQRAKFRELVEAAFNDQP